MLDLAIIGSGPYGISLAAHAEAQGLSYELFGYPMDFWKNKMPPEMFIRTQLEFIGLSDPDDTYTFARYQHETGTEYSYPVPRSIWVDYAFWFAEKTHVRFSEELVHKLDYYGDRYVLLTEYGRRLEARQVVVSVGLTGAEYIPRHLRAFKGRWVTHTNGYTNYNDFCGKRVAVLGGGQSGWEAAALLYQAGAQVDLIYRGSGYESPVPHINARQRKLAPLFYFLTPEEQEEERRELLRATVTEFLVPLVEGKVQQRPYSEVTKAEVKDASDQLTLLISNGDSIEVDHLIVATGYQSRLDQLVFLSPFYSQIKQESNGYPKINERFESSVPGLYFAGPLSAYHHGPAFTQIAGVWHTSRTIIPSLKKNA